MSLWDVLGPPPPPPPLARDSWEVLASPKIFVFVSEPKYFIVVEPVSVCGLLDAQADVIALLCGAHDRLSSSADTFSATQPSAWNLNAEVWIPPDPIDPYGHDPLRHTGLPTMDFLSVLDGLQLCCVSWCHTVLVEPLLGQCVTQAGGTVIH